MIGCLKTICGMESTPDKLWSLYHCFQKYFLHYKNAKMVARGILSTD